MTLTSARRPTVLLSTWTRGFGRPASLPRSIRETVPSSELATHGTGRNGDAGGAAADTDWQAGVAKGDVGCWMGYRWSKKVRTSALKRAGCSMFEA